MANSAEVLPSMDLESELDRLYGDKGATFVAERNKLSKALRLAGNREAADEIGRLPRPTPIAWAVNQLHFRSNDLLATLRETGIELRRAQEGAVPAAEFATRKRAHHQALSAATERALGFIQEDQQPNAGLRRRVEMTLNLWSAAADDVSPPPGRMSAELEPLGFDALTEVARAAPRHLQRQAATLEDREKETRVAAAKATLDAATQEVRRLDGEAKAARATAVRAERDCDDAEARAVQARCTRDAARHTASEVEARLETARAELEGARRCVAADGEPPQERTSSPGE
jgi:hypothetical protein